MSQERADLWRPPAFVRRLSVSNHKRRREADVGMLLKEPRSVNERSSQPVAWQKLYHLPQFCDASSVLRCFLLGREQEVPRSETSPTDCLS